MKQKFTVGDRVRITSTKDNASDKPVGYEFTISEVSCQGEQVWYREFQGKPSGVMGDSLEKIEDRSTSILRKIAIEHARAFQIDQSLLREYQRMIHKPNESLTQKLTNKTMDIIKKLKDLKLSDEDRILRENDLEDENGNMTSDATRMMQDELLEERWKTRRREIAADLKKLKKD